MTQTLVSVSTRPSAALWTPWGPQAIAAKPQSPLASLRRKLAKVGKDSKRTASAPQTDWSSKPECAYEP